MSTQTTPNPSATVRMSGAQLLAELDRLRAENERLALAAQNTHPTPVREVYFAVSPKGAVMVKGLGRWPVTLYSDQWTKLLARVDDLRAFLKENDGALSHKL